MKRKSREPTEKINILCPICGKQAEEGCIYGVDNNALRWLKGSASWVKNIKTAYGGGEIIGESPLLKGSYIKAIRCNSCARIVVDLKGYPDPLE